MTRVWKLPERLDDHQAVDPPGRRRRWRRSQRRRLIAAFALVSIVATMTVGVLAITLQRGALQSRARGEAAAALRADLRQVRGILDAADEDGPFRAPVLEPEAVAFLGELLQPDDDAELLILQPAGGATFATAPDVDARTVPEAVRMQVLQGFPAIADVDLDGQAHLVVGGRAVPHALELYRIVSLAPVDADLALFARSLAIASSVPIATALLVGLFAASRILEPVRRARDAARRVADGWLETRIPVDSDDELSDLSAAFNEMTASLAQTIDQLGQLEARQRRFVADVSHELRTPLTALVAAVDVLEEEGGRDSADRREALRLVVDEVRTLRRLLDDLMEMSRLDARAADVNDAVVAVTSVLVRASERRAWSSSQVSVAVPEAWLVRVDPRRAEAIVANLVGNAIDHARPPVRIRASSVDAGLAIDVEDAGPGIPPAIGERVFERFVKADAARAREAGSGLGLAIARENARIHGGDVTIVRTGPTGTVLRWLIPWDRVVTTEPVPDAPAAADGHSDSELPS